MYDVLLTIHNFMFFKCMCIDFSPLYSNKKNKIFILVLRNYRKEELKHNKRIMIKLIRLVV